MRQLVLFENNAYYAYVTVDRKPKLIGKYSTLAQAKTACREALEELDPQYMEELFQRAKAHLDEAAARLAAGEPPPKRPRPKVRWKVRGVRNFKVIPGGKLGA